MGTLFDRLRAPCRVVYETRAKKEEITREKKQVRHNSHNGLSYICRQRPSLIVVVIMYLSL